MAAFIQKLFRKRAPAASAPAKGSNKKSPQPGSQKPEPRKSAELAEPTGQSQIDQQRAALALEVDQHTLAELALEGLAADIRLKAADGLTDKALLMDVQKRAKNRDKGVYQLTRQRLQAIREEEDRQAATRQAIEQTIGQVEDLAETADVSLYEARLINLERHWTANAANASNEQLTRYLDALHRCRERVEAITREKALESYRIQQNQQRQQTLELLGTTLDELRQQLPSTNALPSLDALTRTQENRWLEATRDTDVSKDQQKQYEASMHAVKYYIAALQRYVQHEPQIEGLIAPTETSEAETSEASAAADILAAIDWPSSFPAPVALDALQASAKAAQQKIVAAKETVDTSGQKEQLERVISQLEESLDANLLKESRQHLKQAQALVKQLGGRNSDPFRARLQRLSGQVHDLGDWQGFATTPKQTALCEQMEYLAAQHMEPEAKAGKIQELQKEWRALGGSSDRTLWQRFKEASDQAFEPCKAYFEAKSDLKKVNLARRQAICDQLAEFLQMSDWASVDWKLAEKIERTAREEWRAAWPVEFRDNRSVQKRFDQELNALSERLDQERLRNEALKAEIVERAEALIEHLPVAEAMSHAKNLQQEWQQVGITRHREDRKLWKAFRAACDQVFARRDEERKQQKDQSIAADNTAREVLARVQAMLESAPTETDPEQLSEIRKTLTSALSTEISQTVRREISDSLAAISEVVASQAQRQQTGLWATAIQQRRLGQLDTSSLPPNWPGLADSVPGVGGEELVVMAEILSGKESPEDQQALRMELQVRRLAQGLGSGAQSHAETSLETLIAQWCLILPDTELSEALEQRLLAVLSD
ncbi:DUF349 domain-containing protein [uncultured Marinobacter sp.]|uniref:DUF349 domain-containing protein n=1 Tax=uncultured Marinobacter sp. TaxID=187379 RepID=UPI0030D6F6D8